MATTNIKISEELFDSLKNQLGLVGDANVTKSEVMALTGLMSLDSLSKAYQFLSDHAQDFSQRVMYHGRIQPRLKRNLDSPWGYEERGVVLGIDGRLQVIKQREINQGQASVVALQAQFSQFEDSIKQALNKIYKVDQQVANDLKGLNGLDVSGIIKQLTEIKGVLNQLDDLSLHQQYQELLLTDMYRLLVINHNVRVKGESGQNVDVKTMQNILDFGQDDDQIFTQNVQSNLKKAALSKNNHQD